MFFPNLANLLKSKHHLNYCWTGKDPLLLTYTHTPTTPTSSTVDLLSEMQAHDYKMWVKSKFVL